MTSANETRLSALDAVLDAQPHNESLAADLFAVVDALDSSPTLRRSITDPSIDERGRQQLVHALLDGKVSQAAVTVVSEGSTQRWAGGRTFAAALERQAVRAQLLQADSASELEETEDELFRFARTVMSSSELLAAISDRSRPLAARQELVSNLLAGKATRSTVVLARRAVAARERSFDHTIEGYVALAAESRGRVIATVRVARPLTEQQTTRLQRALSRQVGREVAIQEIIDEGVIGGVRVELGDEVIEGTVSGRLAAVRKLLT